jgi:hypothetical protein
MSSRDYVGSRVGELEGSKGLLERWGNGTDGGSDYGEEGGGSSGKSLLEKARRLTRRDCALVGTRQAERSAA